MSDCFFCKIVQGDVPSRKVFENDNCYAFLDIFPAAKDVADLLQKKLGSEGTTIFQMNREAGWQTVFHLHMHVIPRWENDDLHKPWDIAPATDQELAEVLHLLQ